MAGHDTVDVKDLELKQAPSQVGLIDQSSNGKSSKSSNWALYAALLLVAATLVVSIVTLSSVNGLKAAEPAGVTVQQPTGIESVTTVHVEVPASAGAGITLAGENICAGKKPAFPNTDCLIDGVIQVVEQAAGNVTKGYNGLLDVDGRVPITEPYWKVGLCPVNVHWHLGAEHFSAGEFDDEGSRPEAHDHHDGDGHRRHLSAEGKGNKRGALLEGHLCHHYDESNPVFTTEYDWKHCEDMQVGMTYEVHWPHSAAGACGTPNQYQTPFYDGVFCNDGIISLDPLNTYMKIGVQGQVFTIVNDESYYYPDLFRGMIVDGEKGQDMAMYTGSTTGSTRDNEICSQYTPITWQVDRKCHLISASSFDKMCADMKAQRDDMSKDLHAHGSRPLVADELAANNHQD